MVEAKDDLASALSRRSQAIFDAAKPTITELAEFADALNMPTAKEQIEASLDGLRRPSFTIAVFGRFSSGKSTLLNALLGRLDRPLSDLRGQGGAPLPMDYLPVTARLTTIRYGEIPTTKVVRSDGSRDKRSLKWFVDNSPLRDTDEKDQEAFGDIEQFELTYPFEAGKAGIVLIDTPGADETPEREAIIQRALDQADAAILLFQASSLASRFEIDFAHHVMGFSQAGPFTVINRRGGMVIDDRYKQFAWARIVKGLKNGPDYAPDRFADERIFFVDVLAALRGRLSNDAEMVRASGIVEFESALAKFYENERRKVHTQRWIRPVLVEANKMISFLETQSPTDPAGAAPRSSEGQATLTALQNRIRTRTAEHIATLTNVHTTTAA